MYKYHIQHTAYKRYEAGQWGLLEKWLCMCVRTCMGSVPHLWYSCQTLLCVHGGKPKCINQTVTYLELVFSVKQESINLNRASGLTWYISVKFQSHCLARLDINLFQTSPSLINVLLQRCLILNSLRLGLLYIGRGAIQLFFSYAVPKCTHSLWSIKHCWPYTTQQQHTPQYGRPYYGFVCCTLSLMTASKHWTVQTISLTV